VGALQYAFAPLADRLSTARVIPMAANLRDDLPDTLKVVRTRPLFVMRLDVRPLQIVGQTPGAFRRIGVVPGGRFEGERLSGEVMEGGADWQAVRADGHTGRTSRPQDK
jgi:Protein of unknown function (DUF3237)